MKKHHENTGKTPALPGVSRGFTPSFTQHGKFTPVYRHALTLVTDRKINPSTLIVIIFLLDLAQWEHESACFTFSNPELCRLTGLSPQTIRRCLVDLTEEKIVTLTEAKNGLPRSIEINLKALAQDTTPTKSDGVTTDKTPTKSDGVPTKSDGVPMPNVMGDPYQMCRASISKIFKTLSESKRRAFESDLKRLERDQIATTEEVAALLEIEKPNLEKLNTLYGFIKSRAGELADYLTNYRAQAEKTERTREHYAALHAASIAKNNQDAQDSLSTEDTTLALGSILKTAFNQNLEAQTYEH